MDSGCRLCNTNLLLINIFELPVQDTVQIKKCIEFATGVSIHQDDEMGKFVCLHCCDTTILAYKFRKNSQKNAIRIHEELLRIKSSNLQLLQSTAYRCPTTKFAQHSTPSTANTSIIQCNISPSMSHILLQYPSLKVSKELFTENVSPVVSLQNIKLMYKIDSDGQVNLRPDFNQYRITQVNQTKLRLKKFSRPKRGDSFNSPADAIDSNDDAESMLNNSDESIAASSSKSFNTRSKAYNNSLNVTESETNLLIPVTYRDEFMCNICNEMLESNMQLEVHMQKCHKVNNAKNSEDSSSESCNITLKKLIKTALSKRKSRKRKRNSVVEAKRISDSSSMECSSASCSADIINIESVPVNSESEAVRFQREMVLELVPIEKDENIRRDYPYIFDTSQFNSSGLTNNEDDMSTTDNNDESLDASVSLQSPTFKSLWSKTLTSNEKQTVHNFLLAVIRTRIQEIPIKPTPILKNAEVQAVTELDSAQIQLDRMGTNEMNVMVPELQLYDMPVSIIKRPEKKDVMTACYIQYLPTETPSKPIDWSKLPKIDLHRQMRCTSTPFSHADSNLNETSGSLPSLISLKDMVYRNRNED